MKILFIGNSHTYCNDMPEIFRGICEKNGVGKVETVMIATPGVGLDYHAQSPEALFNIRHGHYDCVILQHKAHPMGDQAQMLAGADTLIKEVKNAGGEPCLFMTWTQKKNEAGQEDMAEIYEGMGDVYGIKVAPIGRRWWKYRHEHPEIELYAQDGEHASMDGSVLVAQVIYETLFL